MKTLTLLVALLVCVGFSSAFSVTFEGEVLWPTKVNPQGSNKPGGPGPVFGNVVNDPDVTTSFSGTINSPISLNSLPAGEHFSIGGADRTITVDFFGKSFSSDATEYEPTIQVINRTFRGIALTFAFSEGSGSSFYTLRIEGTLWVLEKQFDDFGLAASGYITYGPVS